MDRFSHVILFGSGRLAFQVGRRLRDRNIPLTHIGSEGFKTAGLTLHKSVTEHFREAFQEARVDAARAVYILDDEDRHNIQIALIVMSLSETIPIVVSLFNAEIAAQFQTSRPGVTVRNPALAAARVFTDALRAPLSRKVRHRPAASPPAVNRLLHEVREHRWLYGLACAFFLLLGTGTTVFHFSEGLSWVDAFYFAGTIMTTTGFGDISLRTSVAHIKVFGVGLMVSAVILASLTFSFMADRLFKRIKDRLSGKEPPADENEKAEGSGG